MPDGHWHLSTFFYESIWNLIGFVVILILLRKNKIRQRGVVSASYLIYYGIGRAWIESLRGDSLYIGSMKVSLLLSLILIACGIALLIFYFVKNKKIPQMGEGQTIQEVKMNTGHKIKLAGKQKKSNTAENAESLEKTGNQNNNDLKEG